MQSQPERCRHLIDNMWRAVHTYFIRPCVPRASGASRVDRAIAAALRKLTKKLRTKTNVEEVLRNPNPSKFKDLLRRLKVGTKGLRDLTELQLSKSQSRMRSQICSAYE
jgi:hypothetical protein